MSLAEMPLPTAALTADLVAEIADLRARARSWESVAAEIGWELHELRRALRLEPTFAAALERAKREVDDEAEAEGLQRLRVLMHDKDPKIARDAANITLRHLAAKSRDRTRLEVERLRCETRLEADRLRADRRAGRAAPKEADDDGVKLTPEQEREWEKQARLREERLAAEAAETGAVVWLWGGRHKIVDSKPDEFDVPTELVRDKDALVGGKPIYWVVAHPLATDPIVGPFPAQGYAPPKLHPKPAAPAAPEGAEAPPG